MLAANKSLSRWLHYFATISLSMVADDLGDGVRRCGG